jgi:uncharacterized protein YbaP (TraB family)
MTRPRNPAPLSGLLLLCAGAAWAQGEAQSPPMPEVEVVGSHAGPQMWKMTRGDHVVWILGTLETLPKKLQWDSREVEKVLNEAQEIVPDDYTIDAKIGFFGAIGLILQYRRIQVLKDGKTLQQVLPPDLYARFSALRQRYGHGPKDMERMQPLLAADRLKDEALGKSGLVRTSEVQDRVIKLARRHHVKVHKLTLTLDPKGLLQEIGDMPIAEQAGCLEPVLASLEEDLGVLKERANAWALGDVQALRSIPIVNSEAPCLTSVANARQLTDLEQQATRRWIEGVEDALAHNPVSLAVQDIDHLLGLQGDKGSLAVFQDAGYTIEGPAFSGPGGSPTRR